MDYATAKTMADSISARSAWEAWPEEQHSHGRWSVLIQHPHTGLPERRLSSREEYDEWWKGGSNQHPQAGRPDGELRPLLVRDSRKMIEALGRRPTDPPTDREIAELAAYLRLASVFASPGRIKEATEAILVAVERRRDLLEQCAEQVAR